MDITTFGYLLFLGVGLLVYYSVPADRRWKILSLLSFLYVFSVSSLGLAVILATSFLVFQGARKMDGAEKRQKRRLLIGTLTACFGVLILLKYICALPLFQRPLPLWGGTSSVYSFVQKFLLPAGLSYYTLQTASYVIDVYWGRCPAETSYGKLLLFTCYFPQLVQGPISKYTELAPELFREHPFSWKNIKFGVQLMLWGYFKRLLVADRMNDAVHSIFHSGAVPYGITVLIGLVCYGIQLYGNFSGGIDIIRGASQLFGIGLKENFRQPYFSLSLGEFWRRWHISLGEWVRDYLFYPIAMSGWMRELKKKLKGCCSRRTISRISMAAANLIAFLFVGLWHGLGSNFLGWGLYNGIILAFSALMEDVYAGWRHRLGIREQSRLWYAFRLIRTLGIITLGWVFDCADTAAGACGLAVRLFLVGKTDLSMIQMRGETLVLFSLFFAVLVFVDILHEKKISVREVLDGKSYWVQLIVWSILVQLLACFGKILTAGGFMYANF